MQSSFYLKLVNIATGTIASADVNVDSAVDIGKTIISKLRNKSLSEISLKQKHKSTFAVMRKSITVNGTELKLSSEQLSNRLLASAKRDDVLMEDVFSYELFPVAPALFMDNGMMRKTN